MRAGKWKNQEKKKKKKGKKFMSQRLANCQKSKMAKRKDEMGEVSGSI